MSEVKIKGQYFTPEKIVEQMVSMIRKSPTATILEPSAGHGVFLNEIRKKKFWNVCAVELDDTLVNESNVDIIYADFLSWKNLIKYDVIIGNPPYIRWKNIPPAQRAKLRQNNKCNGLTDILHAFLARSLDLLEDDGEMIFITPDYWLKTSNTAQLRNNFLKYGHFKEIILYGEEKLFKNVNSSILIFKYIKNHKDELIQISYPSQNKRFTHEQFNSDSLWSIIPPSSRNIIKKIEKTCNSKLGDIVDIGNGMVVGLDKAFRINDDVKLTKKEKLKTINVVKSLNLKKFIHNGSIRYIFLNNNDNIEEYPNFFKQLFPYKKELEQRYDYKNNAKWFEWSLLRNYNLISQNDVKIVAPCKERINKKQFVRFSYIKGNYFTSQDVVTIVKKHHILESVKYILGVLNSDITFEWLKIKGLMRGGVLEFSEKPLTEIPFKRINWNNDDEVSLHNKIVKCVDKIIQGKQNPNQMNKLICKLYGI